MQKRFLLGFLILFCALLAACSNIDNVNKQLASKPNMPPRSGMPITKSEMLPNFNSVSITGPFNVKVHFKKNQSNSKLTRVVLKGDSTLVKSVTFSVSKGILTVYVDPNYTYDPDYPIDLDIYTPNLSRFYMKGAGKVTMLNIHSLRLRLIGEGSAYYYLSGYAQRFDATMTGSSRLNAKCLYTRTIFINTTGTTQAEILNNKGGISALASDKSDIYYYSRPDMVAPYQRISGSVMRMQGIAPASIPGPAEDTKIPADKIVEGRG